MVINAISRTLKNTSPNCIFLPFLKIPKTHQISEPHTSANRNTLYSTNHFIRFSSYLSLYKHYRLANISYTLRKFEFLFRYIFHINPYL